MEYTFIHAADIHLDSPLRGLEQYEGAPVEEIRGSTRKAFTNLIDTALDEKVAFLILAGDLYDGDWKDYYTGLFFAKQMSRLREAGIFVYLIKGNHDAASVISKSIRLPDNVFVFPSDHPGTYYLEEWDTVIHGQSFATRSVTKNLVHSYPKQVNGYLNIGLLHTSVSGREGHESYAPCQLEDLKEKGYDYWALGHVHTREILQERDPTVLFSGNIQGRHIREQGEKGCTLVRVHDQYIQNIEHRTLDVLRWEKSMVDVSSAETMDEVLQLVEPMLEEKAANADGRLRAIRIQLHGDTPVHTALQREKDELINNLRSLAIDIGDGDIWIEKVKWHTTSRVTVEELRDEHSPVAAIFQYIDTLKQDEAEIEEITSLFSSLTKDLPKEVFEEEEGLHLEDRTLIKNHVEQAQDLMLSHLTKKKGGSI